MILPSYCMARDDPVARHRHRHRGSAQPLRPVPRAERPRRGDCRMRPFLALIRESRFTKPAGRSVFQPRSSSAWVGCSSGSRRSTRPRSYAASVDDSEQGRIQMLRMMGVTEEPSSLSLIMAFWSHPLHILVDLDLGDRPWIGRGCRRGRTRDDGPPAFTADSRDGSTSPQV